MNVHSNVHKDVHINLSNNADRTNFNMIQDPEVNLHTPNNGFNPGVKTDMKI